MSNADPLNSIDYFWSLNLNADKYDLRFASVYHAFNACNI